MNLVTLWRVDCAGALFARTSRSRRVPVHVDYPAGHYSTRLHDGCRMEAATAPRRALSAWGRMNEDQMDSEETI